GWGELGATAGARRRAAGPAGGALGRQQHTTTLGTACDIERGPRGVPLALPRTCPAESAGYVLGTGGTGGAGRADAVAAAATAATAAAVTGETLPSSVTSAVTRPAGVMSKARFSTATPGGTSRRPPSSATSPGDRRSMGMDAPSAQARSIVEVGAAT